MSGRRVTWAGVVLILVLLACPASGWAAELPPPVGAAAETTSAHRVQETPADTLDTEGDEDEGEADRAWANARALADQERYAEALVVIREALAKHPEETALLWLEAGVTGWSGHHQESVALFETMVSKHPEMKEDVRLDLAGERLWAGDAPGALRDVDRRLEVDPHDEEAGRLRALALAHADRLTEALAAYDQLLQAHPEDTELMLGRAQALGWSGRHPEAIEAYRQVLAKDSSNADARMGLALNQNWSGRHREAAAMFQDILRDPEADDEALKGLAYAQYWAGRADKADAPLERYRTLHPEDPEGEDLARMLAREFHPGFTGGYDWSSDSDDLHVFTTTLDYRLTANPRGAVLLSWRRDRVEDDAGRRAPNRLGVGYERIWSDVFSSGATLWGLKPGSGHSSRALGDIQLTVRPRDGVQIHLGYAREPVLTRLSLERDVDTHAGTVSVEWKVASKLSADAEHEITHYTDGNRARRSSLGLDLAAAKRRRFEATLTADFELLRVRDDLDNGYYDPKQYVETGPGVSLKWMPREAMSVEIASRFGAQRERGSNFEPYHNLRAIVDVPIGRRLSLYTELGTSDSNLSSASGFRQHRWATYLSVPF